MAGVAQGACYRHGRGLEAAAAEGPAKRAPSSKPERRPGAPHYTIDELAARAGIPSRTIRFYQTQGTLPPPRRAGRVALYGEEHIERLRLVALLQSRGLRLRAIADLLTRGDPESTSVRSWLGLDERLTTPWSEDQPRVVDTSGLRRLLRTSYPGALESLTRIEAVLPRSDGSYLVPRPRLLEVILDLEAAGVSLDTAAGAGEILRRELGRAADALVGHFAHHLGAGFGRRPTPDEVGRALEVLRTRGVDAVRLIFAQEMERALRALVDPAERVAQPAARRRSGRGG